MAATITIGEGRRMTIDEREREWNRCVAWFNAGKMTKEELDTKRAEIWGPF